MYMRQPTFFFPFHFMHNQKLDSETKLDGETKSTYRHCFGYSGKGWVEILFTDVFQQTSKGATGCGILCLLQGGYLMYIHVT